MTITFGAARYSVGWRVLTVSMMCFGVASCGTTSVETKKPKPRSKEYFSEKEYGVKASPRVAYGKNIPKGGGRYMVGDPYVVRGKTYVPKEDFAYNKVGIASWYGSAFHGRLTANGEVYDLEGLSAAHPTFPLPSYARVTNVENGSSIVVRVNDRGPFHSNRLIDVSSKTAEMLDLKHSGTGKVRVQYVGRARMDGHDMPYLMASYVPKGARLPRVAPEGQIATGVMVASNQSMREQIRAMDDGDSAIRTSLAGNTPSQSFEPKAAAPMARPEPAAFTAFDQSVMLPDIGPVPRERPQYNFKVGASYAAAYTDEQTVTVHLAFDAVMARNDGLTSESILRSVERRQAPAAVR